VQELIAQTLPFSDPDLSVPALGVVEVALGLVLAVGVLPRVTPLVLAGHLAGTFLSFVTASELMWGANVFELTADGEFVAKNLVLITTALVLIGIYSRRDVERASA
jgi:putative oxidoreductase